MSTAKFTPGPWKVTRNTTPGQLVTDTKVRDRHDGVVCVVHIDAEANARLIAAAPELLACIEQLLDPTADTVNTARELVARVKGGGK